MGYEISLHLSSWSYPGWAFVLLLQQYGSGLALSSPGFFNTSY